MNTYHDAEALALRIVDFVPALANERVSAPTRRRLMIAIAVVLYFDAPSSDMAAIMEAMG